MSNAPSDPRPDPRPAGPTLRAVETVPAPEAEASQDAGSPPPAAGAGADAPPSDQGADPGADPGAAAAPLTFARPGLRARRLAARARLQAVPASPAPAPVPPAEPEPAVVPGVVPGVAPSVAPAAPAAGRAPGARPARFRPRHYGVALSFLLAVLLPLAVSAWYLFARAADQYHSETAFSVRSEEMGASVAAGLIGALTQVGGGSAADTDILYDYIRSQEMVQAVDARLDLRTIYNRAAPRDVVFSLGQDPSIEDLVAYWRRMVHVDFESHAGIITVRANAFTPEDATAIANAVLAESGALVNRLSDQARADAVSFSEEQLARAEANLKTQRTRLAEFRHAHKIIDPSGEVAGQSGIVNALERELARAMVARDELLSFVGEDDQRVVQAQRRIDAIQGRVDAERTAVGSGGDVAALSDVVGDYEALRIDLEFANTAYTSALAGVAAASAEARRQSRYLAAHVAPTSAERALYPRRMMLSGLILLFLTLGWGIVMLVYYNVRDSR